MQMKNVEWLPIVASIGIGAATYSVMTGKGGQLQNLIPAITNMASGQGQNQNSQSSMSGQNQSFNMENQYSDEQSFS
ncbi:hypothetical protein ACLIA0_07270 [Bacillaceae bacterium W0354]